MPDSVLPIPAPSVVPTGADGPDATDAVRSGNEAAEPPPAALAAALPDSLLDRATDAREDNLAPPTAQPVVSTSAGGPAECGAALKRLFPALFTGATKPLKLRIQVDIQERAPGQFSKAQLSAFFRRHTGSTSYLIAVSRATHRFDLDGQPSGELTADHRQMALDELGRRRANQDARRDAEEQQRRSLEQERRNRAGLLHAYQTTTLTPANFCALKGVAVGELEALLALARTEAEERVHHAPTRPGDEPREAGRGDPRRKGFGEAPRSARGLPQEAARDPTGAAPRRGLGTPGGSRPRNSR